MSSISTPACGMRSCRSRPIRSDRHRFADRMVRFHTMPARNTQNSNRDELDSPASHPPVPALRGSRWQLVTASILLAIWIVFLLAMSLYS